MSAQSIPSYTENERAPILVEVVRNYDTEQLIQFLRKHEDLNLNDTHFEVMRSEEITGRTFLLMTEDKLMRAGLKMGPASVLVGFARDIKEKTTDTFSRQVSNVREMFSDFGTRGLSYFITPLTCIFLSLIPLSIRKCLTPRARTTRQN